MSSPPSPIRRQHSEVPTTSAPGQPPGQPGPSTEAPSPVTTAVQQAGTRSTLQASLSISITEQQQPQTTTAGATSAVPLERHTFYTAPGPGESTNVPAVGAPLRSGITASTSRPARRSKAHVASACINCKRAHLSCDVQRPCSRCVASGKQDTCVDVQHKKRGRPRLREESEFGIQRSEGKAVTAGQPPALQSSPTPAPVRPILGTRRQRAESLRSLASQTSDESYALTGSTPARSRAGTLQSPFSSQRPPEPGHRHWSSYEIPTALLNTDFVIVRANRPFQQIMFAGRDVGGRHISEIAAPADNESFQAIRNTLRAEREARDLTYMPPILQPGQDPISRIPEAEADQYTGGFNEHHYTWAKTQMGPAGESFPARVRLAKANTYFVVVTLPSFRPVEPAPPAFGGFLHSAAPMQPMLSAYDTARQSAVYSAPPMAAYPAQTSIAPMQPGPSVGVPPASYTYPPPPQPQMHPAVSRAPPHSLLQPFLPQQQPPAPPPRIGPAASPIPRLRVREPPVETSAFTPRSAPTESLPILEPSELQLPPISLAPTTTTIAASARRAQQAGSSEEDGEGQSLRSPRKRRRLGIDDVLQ